MSTSNRPQVFISYAHDDLETVDKLYHDLKRRDVRVWWDKEDLGLGKWKPQIEKAIAKSRYFLFCMSRSSLLKAKEGSGFVDEELQKAVEIAAAQSERLFTIVPVCLEKGLGHGDHRLSIFNQIDLYNNWQRGVDRLATLLGGTVIAPEKEKEEGYLLSQDSIDNILTELEGKERQKTVDDMLEYSHQLGRQILFGP